MRELAHQYPKNVHILDHPYTSTLLTQLSQSHCVQPRFNQILTQVYRAMATDILAEELAQKTVQVSTRMEETHPESPLTASVFDPEQKTVVVDVARAGMLPSQIFFDELCGLLNPIKTRLDHVFAARIVDANQTVTHTELSSSKIGGDIDQAVVIIPDPMGATGHSISEVIAYYKKHISGTPKKWITAHLIITPEFIRTVTESHPDVTIYTGRLDRGLSSEDVLQSEPGTFWDKEVGLSKIQYIVPGAGGVGELINNAFV